jgi:hypothetical protein
MCNRLGVLVEEKTGLTVICFWTKATSSWKEITFWPINWKKSQ